jgi:uncharacterized membrane protein YGL010W
MATPTASNRKVDKLLEEYGSSHTNKMNKAVHWICVPIIFFSIFGLVRSIPTPAVFAQVPYLSWASILLVLTFGYYISLSIPLTLGFIFFGAVVVLGNEFLFSNGALYLCIVSALSFVVAWVGQFIGHGVEGKKPSFLKDLQFLLVGPAWLMHFIYKKLGLRY